LVVGYCKEQDEKYKLCHQITDVHTINEKIESFISINFSKTEYEFRRNRMLSEKIDGTAFLVWFVENYPESEKIMRENPDYQYNFK